MTMLALESSFAPADRKRALVKEFTAELEDLRARLPG
jgi:hypothetical protein